MKIVTTLWRLHMSTVMESIGEFATTAYEAVISAAHWALEGLACGWEKVCEVATPILEDATEFACENQRDIALVGVAVGVTFVVAEVANRAFGRV